MRGRNLSLIAIVAFTAALAISSLRAGAADEQTPEEREEFVEGAKLWPVYCAQCHNARPGSQFSPAQWDAITMHMRTLSNMPAKDMRAIKVFLKEAR
jgi:mono/diheme cytochrome c family protein